LKANSASCWFLLYGYTTMHGEQNIKSSLLLSFHIWITQSPVKWVQWLVVALINHS